MQCSDKRARLLVVRPVAWVAARSEVNQHTSPRLLLHLSELDWQGQDQLYPVTLTSPPSDRLGWIVG
jgi:hypothetical protein